LLASRTGQGSGDGGAAKGARSRADDAVDGMDAIIEEFPCGV